MDRGALGAMKPEAQAPESDRIWELIDAVLVINLGHRSERWNQFTQMATGLIPMEKVHRVDAVYGPDLDGFGQAPWFRGRKRDKTWGARAGCTLSHKKALQTAADNHWETVLILEDDIEIDSAFRELKDSIYDLLIQNRDHWELVYFGFTDPWGPFKKITDLGEKRSLQQVYGCNCAHAYLVSAKVRQWALGKLPNQSQVWNWLSAHRAVDRWYRNTLGRHFKILCLSPGIFNQTAGFSDIVGKETDRHENVAHTTHITAEKRRNQCLYQLLYRFRIARSWMNEAYDRSRGLWKKLRGF